MPKMNIHSYQYALKNSLFSQALKDPCRTHFAPQSFELDRSVVVFLWGTQFVDSLFWHTVTCSRELVFQARFSLYLCCLCYSRIKFWKTTSRLQVNHHVSEMFFHLPHNVFAPTSLIVYMCHGQKIDPPEPGTGDCGHRLRTHPVKRLTIDPYWVWAFPHSQAWIYLHMYS